MLARFTQVDYDRELALVALPREPQGGVGEDFVAVARYVLAGDDALAEFAIVVADAWQHRGVGRALMQRLMDVARANGVTRLEGAVLRANASMLRFATSLGFTARVDADSPDQVLVSRAL